MALFLFARFHAREGNEGAVERALAKVVEPSREEVGCIEIHAYRSTHDSRLFYIHSRWKDEAAFEIHAVLPHTTHFIENIESLVDQPVEISRAHRIA
jgi:quinol monooxygenase YgiN